MKLFVKTQGKVIGPLEWERILLAEDKGRFSPDVLVSEDKINWMTIGEVRQSISRSTGYNQGEGNAAGYYQPVGNMDSMMPQGPYGKDIGTGNGRSSDSRNLLFIGGMVTLLVIVFVLIAVVVGICLKQPHGNYDAIAKHIDLWMQACQTNTRDITIYASNDLFLYSPMNWKIVSPKSDFDGKKNRYHVKVLVDSATKEGTPVRTIWDFTIERDTKRPTGYCITQMSSAYGQDRDKDNDE